MFSTLKGNATNDNQTPLRVPDETERRTLSLGRKSHNQQRKKIRRMLPVKRRGRQSLGELHDQKRGV
jgi:ribosomal protein L13